MVTVDDPQRTRRITFLVLAVIFTILMAVGARRVPQRPATRRARAPRPTSWRPAFHAAGLPDARPRPDHPDARQRRRGGLRRAGRPRSSGPSCNGLLVNGAGGPGQRPVLADRKALQGEALIIQTYCPEELPAFTEYVANLDLSDGVAG